MMLADALQMAIGTLEGNAQQTQLLGGNDETVRRYKEAAQRLRAFSGGWRALMFDGWVEMEYRNDERQRTMRDLQKRGDIKV